jgi:pectinesterase
MEKIIFVILTCTIISKANTQSLLGVTGKKDTSFSNYSAYISTLKTHPQIKLAGEFHSPSITEKKNIIYSKFGKRKLMLDVFYANVKTKIKQTAILIIHGGGWWSGNRTQHYPLAQRLANLGYVCVTPEYRLSTEALYPAAVYDLKSALRWIRKNANKYNIDTNKITVLGFSAGGELAAFIGTTNKIPEFEGTTGNIKYSSKVNAVVNIDGILSFMHPESGEGDDSKRTSAATYWFGYSKIGNPQLWQQASALTYVGKDTPPTLFINSAVDRMHAGREDYIKILNAHAIYSELKNFAGAPHSFCLFDPWFEPTIKYIDDFLKKVYSPI